MKTIRIILSYLAALSLIACMPQNDSSMPVSPDTSSSSYIENYSYQNQRIALPAQRSANFSVLRNANHAMTGEVYNAIHNDNFVVAPYEITQNIAQLALAANGTTRDELLQSIGISPDNKSLFELGNTLDLQLVKDNSDFSRYSLLIGQVKYPYITSYLDASAKYFGAVMAGVDFLAPDAATQIQNAVIKVAPDATGLYLDFTNRSRLEVGNGMQQTVSGYNGLTGEVVSEIRFGSSGGEQVVPGIKLTGTITYAETDDYQAFDLPLGRGTRSLTIIMPKDNRYTAVESQIEQQLFDDVIKALQPTPQTTVYLPAFNFSSDTDVSALLAGLGSSTAFVEGAADFSGVNGTGYLFLKRIKQQSYIALGAQGLGLYSHGLSELMATRDEPPSYSYGYNAGVFASGVWVPPCTNTIDARSRPFIFLLRDKAVDIWYAVGRVTQLSGVGYDPCSNHIVYLAPEFTAYAF